jgi:hypothetical protein
MKARELSDAERNAQIVALWQGRAHERQPPEPENVAAFFQWLCDYTPWLVPRDERARVRIRAMLRRMDEPGKAV